MQERMYKVKLTFLSLTWVWLKLNIQQQTIQERTSNVKLIFEFDLSLTKIQFLIQNQCRSACAKSNYFLNLTWVWLKLSIQHKTNAGTQEQSQTHFCLTCVWLKYNLQLKTMQERMCKVKLNFVNWVWLELD